MTSPSKGGTLDFGDIEIDSSAKSQRQQRKDSHATIDEKITDKTKAEGLDSGKDTKSMTSDQKTAESEVSRSEEIYG